MEKKSVKMARDFRAGSMEVDSRSSKKYHGTKPKRFAGRLESLWEGTSQK